MRWGNLLMLVGLSIQAGCLLARNTVHNLVNETVTHVDENALTRRLKADARAAWELYCKQTGGSYSADFADGFREGYADYLESGGNGSPPAVPPLRYRRSEYLSPEGHARIREYFAGFKTGVDVAQASGHRDYMTVPVLVPDQPPPPPIPGKQISTAPVRVGEQLPLPRQMDPMTGLPTPVRPLAETPNGLPAIPTVNGPDKVPTPPGPTPTGTPAATPNTVPGTTPSPAPSTVPMSEKVSDPLPNGIPEVPNPVPEVPAGKPLLPTPRTPLKFNTDGRTLRTKGVLEDSLQPPEGSIIRRSILPDELPPGRRVDNE